MGFNIYKIVFSLLLMTSFQTWVLLHIVLLGGGGGEGHAFWNSKLKPWFINLIYPNLAHKMCLLKYAPKG